ncbi:hypothetical protein [Paractinoplanes maris]|uniref:hypothetical protein n=1 Tax=Paractinoplanes maris TaxID=1734446 RepID=UPI00201FEA3A|nr:hypothetical protein [Actinoplanes maris]
MTARKRTLRERLSEWRNRKHEPPYSADELALLRRKGWRMVVRSERRAAES